MGLPVAVLKGVMDVVEVVAGHLPGQGLAPVATQQLQGGHRHLHLHTHSVELVAGHLPGQYLAPVATQQLQGGHRHLHLHT